MAAPKSYLEREVKARWGDVGLWLAIVLLVTGLSCLVWVPVIDRVTTRHVEVTATATDESTINVRVGRRSSQLVERRVVTLTYPMDGRTITARAQSETVQVGSQTQAWVEANNPEVVVLEKPTLPGVGWWIGSVVAALVVFVVAAIWVGQLRNALAMARFRPDGGGAVSRFQIEAVDSKLINPQKPATPKNTSWIMKGHVGQPDGSSKAVTLTGRPTRMPEMAQLTNELETVVIRDGAAALIAARGHGQDQSWWVAEMTETLADPLQG